MKCGTSPGPRTLGTGVIAAFGLLFRIWVVNRTFLLLFWVLPTVLVIASRTIIRASLAYLRRHGKNMRNMLVIGTNPRALELVDRIQHKPELGYRILGFADENWNGIEDFKKTGSAAGLRPRRAASLCAPQRRRRSRSGIADSLISHIRIADCGRVRTARHHRSLPAQHL